MDSILKIMDLPEMERPRERLLRFGPECLSNSDLLAVILRTGTRNENIVSLCSRLLKESGGLNGLINMTVSEYREITGIGDAKAASLIALMELCKRIKSYKSGNDYKIVSPKDAADLLMEEMRYLKKEYLKVILLNTKNVVLTIKDVSVGSLNSSIVHPREVFTYAVRDSSSSIIICHNHPSGDPTPSEEDINITRRLSESGRILGIELLDHIIIGDGTFVSLKEKGII
ncbi:MAG: DNA repair protein RadC [Bacillota bacterium]|nr:DNA repair protein RadC [Bacillota bacterium]